MIGSLFSGFDKSKTKANIKLSIQRMQLVRNKKLQYIDGAKRRIKDLLLQNKEEQARIQAENVNLLQIFDPKWSEREFSLGCAGRGLCGWFG
mmetsp:Transcript_37524/g.118350  ORF Transcript_37524/g.118350 Transcript_37524/m.118350 type:complete len:92 (+) Transcript_37524:312-587(+)